MPMLKCLHVVVIFAKRAIASATLSIISFCAYSGQDYHAGYMRIVATDKRFGEFPIALWFPTKQPARVERFGPFTLKIALGAQLA